MWLSDVKMTTISLSLDEIKDTALSKILLWYRVSFSGWLFSFEDVTGIEVIKKKNECRKKILSKYSESDQINITWDSVISWNKEELIQMRTFINNMLSEFRLKWKNANYDWISI